MQRTATRTWRPLALPLATFAALLGVLLPSAPARADATVTTVNNGGNTPYAYEPATVTIGVGESVTFVNPAGTPLEPSQDHPTYCGTPGTRGECPWSSFPLGPGDSMTIDFPTEGTFGYACSIHPYMEGTVIVGDGEPDAAPEPSEPEPSEDPTEDASDGPTSNTSDEPTDGTTDGPSDDATDGATDGEEVSDEPTAEETVESTGPRDALSGIGGTVSNEPVEGADDSAAPTSSAGGGSPTSNLSAEELAGQDRPTGFRSLITLSVMGILAGGGMLVLRRRRG